MKTIENFKNKVICGDCLEVMKEIPDKSVDLVLTDPPYWTTACKWDTVIPFDLMWEQLKRIIKPNGAIVLFWSEPFSSALRMSNIKNYKYDWIWEKTRWTWFQIIKYKPLNFYENISVFCNWTTYINHCELKKLDKPIKSWRKKKFWELIKEWCKNENQMSEYTNYSRNIIKIASDHNVWKYKFHPTQKPVALIEYLIKTYSLEDDVILDFTSGSWTTWIAAQNTNRKFILIENDKNYYDISLKRLQENKETKEII